MQKLYLLLICYFITNLAAADYYDEFAKQYEKDHSEIVHPQKEILSSEEVIEGWQNASAHFKTGYRPVLNEDGVLLDWVPRDCPND